MCWTKEIAAKIVIKACSYIFAQKIFVLPKRLRWGRSETQWLTCPVRSVCSWLPGRPARDVLWRRGRRRSDHWPKKINRLGSALLGTLQEAGQDTGQTSGYGTPATMRAGFKESAGQPPTQHQRPTLILFIDMDQILQHHRLFLLPPSSTRRNSIVCAFKCAGLYIENQHHRHQSKFFDHSQVLIDPPPISLPSSRQYSRLHLYTRDKYEARCIPGPRASSVQCNRRIWIWARNTRLRLLFRYIGKERVS